MNDVDTDLIIPAQYLTSTSREGFGENLFRRLRDGDPSFPLNQPRFQGAEILVVGENFGCGSSREHAVWALQGAGFRAIIGKSFADIFSSNSGNNGLLLVQLEEEAIQALLQRAAEEELQLTVDLEALTVAIVGDRGGAWSFHYDPFRRHCLLNGLDTLDYLRSFSKEITAFEASRGQAVGVGEGA
jgi:3-isopropylmalate/(R)-2-methylmalate dehydratase small subunit